MIKIVYGPKGFGKTKIMLDDMHKRKIDMADEIFVINKNGYVGESETLTIIQVILDERNEKKKTCHFWKMIITFKSWKVM